MLNYQRVYHVISQLLGVMIMVLSVKNNTTDNPNEKPPGGCEWMFSWYVHTGLMELGKPSPKKE